MKLGLYSVTIVERAEPAALVATFFLGRRLHPLVFGLGRGGFEATIEHAVAAVAGLR